MSTVRQINDIFSEEAKSVRMVKALVEFYKSSAPDDQVALEPGLYLLVSAIHQRLKDPLKVQDSYHQESLEAYLADEGMVPVMDRWELEHALESRHAAPRVKV